MDVEKRYYKKVGGRRTHYNKIGDIIDGRMTNKGGGTWFVGAAVVGTTLSSNIQVSKPRLISQPWAYCTLEVMLVRGKKGRRKGRRVEGREVGVWKQ
jgi:hypothetical protein